MTELPDLLPARPDLTLRLFSPNTMPGHRRHSVRMLVDAVANDFLPSLWHRVPEGSGATTYAEGLLTQNNLLVTRGPELLALLSYRHSLTDERYEPAGRAAVNITTVAVLPEARRQGLARHLYDTLIDLVTPAGEVMTVRTWSSNWQHLALLDALGFAVTNVSTADRGPGVDTVHLALDTWASPLFRAAAQNV